MKKKPLIVDNDKELESLLIEIENDLVKEIPAAVRAEKIKKPSYGIHMRFVQMPYGPDRLDLRLSLMKETELPLDFFEPTSQSANNGEKK